MSKLDTIRAQVLAKYGSLKEPNFAFVRAALAADMYRDVMDAIGASFKIDEDTDPNDDVSRAFVVTTSDGYRTLALSMVAPYAVFMRPTSGPSYEVVDPAKPLSPEEARLLGILRQFEVEPLDRWILSEPMPLELSNTPADQCCVYQALFTDTDVLPWEAPLDE